MRLMKLVTIILCFFQVAVSMAADTTVIFEAGFGTKGQVWDPVIALLPNNVKVINETRSSLMTPDAEPTTLAQDVAAMQKRIKQASQNGNVIVVGHSYGGLVATQTLKSNVSEIDGMVLIEPTTLVHRLRFKALDKERVIADDLVIAKYMPPHLQAQYQRLTDTLDQAKEALIPLPASLPTILFTSTQIYEKPMFIEETQKGKALWLQLHNALFQQVETGQHIRSNKWGHSVHIEAPEEVAQAIMKVVEMSALKEK